MLILGLICTFVAAASAGYASSSSGAGLYSDNSYGNTYSSKFPYSNSYTGYAGGGAYSSVPVGPFYSPYDFQNQFNAYYNSISDFNQKHLTTSYAGDGASVSSYASLSPPRHKHYEDEQLKNLFKQQLDYQAAIWAQNQAIQNQIQHNIAAISGAAYGGGYGYQPSYGVPNRFGGSTGGTSSFASGGAFAGTSGGGSVGSYGGVRPGGHVYGGTTGGHRPQYSPNYATSGGAVSTGGYQQQHAAIYPANPARPNLDSRFGDDGGSGGIGVTHTQTGHRPGFVGVSSFSSSSDINGVKQQQSGTSVNKDGKVTTYYTRN